MPRVRALLAVALFMSTALASCNGDTTTIDQFPVRVDLNAGPVMLYGSVAQAPATGDPDAGVAEAPFATIVDTLSPLTVVDSFLPGVSEAVDDPRRRQVALTLLGVDAGGGPGVPRARFSAADALDLHVCLDPDAAPEDAVACLVGRQADPRAFRGIIGADLLSRTAVRFDFPASELRLFPNIAGDETERTDSCDAVFGAPFFGGGTLLIGGAELSYDGRRAAVGTCIFNAQLEETEGRVRPNNGVDGLFLISTGLPITLISESAYERYQRSGFASAAPLADLPTETLFLPAGRLVVQTDAALSVIDNLALVGEASDTRGPCNERYANYFFYAFPNCPSAAGDSAAPCPCENKDDDFCRTSGVVEVQGVQVAVLPDSDPMLHALRSELRPDLPEVDGILGVNALARTVMDMDYPNARMLLRCADATGCSARPAALSQGSLDTRRACPGVRALSGFGQTLR